MKTIKRIKTKNLKNGETLKQIGKMGIFMKEIKMFDIAEKNLEFFNENFKKFEEEYPNKFVAVSGSKVVAIENTPEKIFEELDAKNISRSKVLVEFIPIAGSILVL